MGANPTTTRATAAALIGRVTEHERISRPDVDDLKARASRILEASRLVERSWSGWGFGYHWDLYYGDFEKPPLEDSFSVEWGGIHGLPPEWHPRTPEEVRDRIEHLSGTSIDKLRSDDVNLVKSAEQLLEDLLIDLGVLVQTRGSSEDQALLQEIRELKWGREQETKYIAQALKTLPNMTRDSEAFAQGLRVPSHSYYASVAAGISAHCEAIERLWKLSLRLTKQLEARPASKVAPPSPRVTPDAKSLSPPGEVTLAWLFHRVSWRLWSGVAGALLAAFVAGVYMGQIGWVRQLAHIAPERVESRPENIDSQLNELIKGHNERQLEFQKAIAREESAAASSLLDRDAHLKAAQTLRDDMRQEEEAYRKAAEQLRSLPPSKRQGPG
jgi:hypothetical protein